MPSAALLNVLEMMAVTPFLPEQSHHRMVEGGMTMTEALRKRLEELKGKPMPASEFEAQRLSFIYGNAPKEDKGTKEDVRRSITEPDYAPLGD